jgi:trk system potassium uptake protein TrkH
VLNALFQSVSLRTAGFNTLALDGLERSTILMMIVWMFIGAVARQHRRRHQGRPPSR